MPQFTYLNNKVCLIALDAIIKRAFDIIETTDDYREKLQAMEVFKDTHLIKLELLSNATTIDTALNYIRSKQQQQQQHQQKKHLSLDSINGGDTRNSNTNSGITTAGRQTVF
jgi:hypothetical protein